jgi:hypothetical protein
MRQILQHTKEQNQCLMIFTNSLMIFIMQHLYHLDVRAYSYTFNLIPYRQPNQIYTSIVYCQY